MAKGQKEAADKQLQTTNAAAAGAGKNAGDIFSSLNPFFQQEMTNPQGYSPQDLNAMRTGSSQALGGSTAGITGQGNLTAARTRNSAGITSALDSAARGAQQQGSQNELAIEGANANLKQQQQQAGAAGEAGLFGENLGAQSSLYGLGPGTLQGRAAGGSWAQNTFQPVVSSLFPGPGH